MFKKAQVVVIVLIASLNGLLAQNNLELSLLTCSPGEEIYSTFGHSAIRIQDKDRGVDYVFDYGTFDFNTPNFTLKFIKGDLEYRLSIREFNEFMLTYEEEGKGVIEERFNLTPTDKALLYKWLKDNHKPENRYYKYDFFFDNCSTRIRDLVEGLPSVAYDKEEKLIGKTFNDGLNEFFSNKKWLGLGINLVLGQSADKEMSYRAQMFLPKYLSKNLSSYTNTENGKSVLESAKALLPNTLLHKKPSFSISPILCFSLFLLLTLFIAFRKPEWSAILTPMVYVILGCMGLLLLFLWFGTTHYTTRYNWNVIWANPLYLSLLFMGDKKVGYYTLLVLSLLTLLLLASWLFIPQNIDPVFILVILGVLVLNFVKIKQLNEA